MTAQDHGKLLGIFHLIQGGLQSFAGIVIALVYGGLGLAFRANAQRPEEQFMGTIFVILAFIVAPIVLAFAAVNLIAGYKLLKEKAGARNWGIAASVISLLSIPLGTALGIYGLWFLYGENGRQFYLNERHQNAFAPPPPQNWQ
jgi:cytochrome bd-type quinol oxidase subunit 2